MKQIILLVMLAVLAFRSNAQDEQKAVLSVINEFFTHLESQDTTAFRNLHVENSKFYIVAERNDTVRTFSRDVTGFKFNKKEILKERMRNNDVKVNVHGRVATVWAPYDIWVNETFSHCGIDAFTLVKSADGWKIASCAYTVETKNCDTVK